MCVYLEAGHAFFLLEILQILTSGVHKNVIL